MAEKLSPNYTTSARQGIAKKYMITDFEKEYKKFATNLNKNMSFIRRVVQHS